MYVLIHVGCLECGDSTQVEGVFEDHGAALAAFESLAEVTDQPIVDLEDDRGTAIALAGHGGSYWYPVQLHESR